MSFVYYRLPHSRQIYCNKLSAEPEELSSLSELNGRGGFVIAPFVPSDDCPVLLLPAEWQKADVADGGTLAASLVDADYDEERLHYGIDFENYHAQLLNGSFAKIVLARSARLKATESIAPLQLFARACRMYPRMFIALFSTRRSGTWIVATPEILVSGQRGEMQTMALAGTMRLSGRGLGFDVPGSGVGEEDMHWSVKNVKEQRYVETYITECIERFAADFSVDGPYTSRAGDLVHLRSDIRFRLEDTSRLGDLLNELHPTPAVCGMPKDSARDFIMANESAPRGYYSGFSGLIAPDGETRLFVTLRCMRIEDGDTYRLYAGGGLLGDSTCQAEWDETEAKMNTMRRIFKP